MTEGNLTIEPIVQLGPVTITNTVVTTWAIMAVIWLLAWSVSRRLCIEPGPVQTAVEGIVSTIENAVAEGDGLAEKLVHGAGVIFEDPRRGPGFVQRVGDSLAAGPGLDLGDFLGALVNPLGDALEQAAAIERRQSRPDPVVEGAPRGTDRPLQVFRPG